MKLIIAEKPSLAQNIASALGVKKREDGYLENDKYIVSWAFGHLYTLKNVDDYIGKKTSWKDLALPFVPVPFEFKIKTIKNKDTGIEEADKGIQKQIEILKKLVNRIDITEIINAGDADREGQIIIDIILEKIAAKKTIKRLWLPEQTEATIQKQMEKLEDNSKYYALSQEGYARTYMDWLFGINLTRYVTLKANKLLPVGRVLIPVVKYVYDRELEIKNFVKEKYFQLESRTAKDNVPINLIIKKKKYRVEEKLEATINANILNTFKGIVKSIEKKEIKKISGKLFSLSNLQSYLSKKYKIGFVTSLDVIQSLYEDGLISYPRTNTEYLSENEKGKVKEIIESLSDYNLILKDTKKIFDDSKIESHSALIITTKKPNNLAGNRATIYNSILNRFISNFLNEDTITEKVTMTIIVGEEEFKLNGEAIKQQGFYKYEPEKFENQLPHLDKNEEFNIEFTLVEKETLPPKKVSEEDLAKYLKNPFKKEEDSEDEEYQAILQGVEIGTEATRTGIVENAKKYEYISQEGANYSLEILGEKLIEILNQLKINMYKEKSIEFSKLQKKVFKGEAKLEDLIELTNKEIEKIVGNNIEIYKFDSEDKSETRFSIGKCPRCGTDVYEGKKTYNCKDKICNFTLWKTSKRYSDSFEISLDDAKKLLCGKSPKITLTKPDGIMYKENLKIKLEGNYVNFEIVRAKK